MSIELFIIINDGCKMCVLCYQLVQYKRICLTVVNV